MYVRAVLDEGVMDRALLAPQLSISRDAAGQPMAYVVDAAGRLEQRSLVTPSAIGDQWLVTSGLKAGDRLVVSGQQKARPGAQVQIVMGTYGTAAAVPAATGETPTNPARSARELAAADAANAKH